MPDVFDASRDIRPTSEETEEIVVTPDPEPVPTSVSHSQATRSQKYLSFFERVQPSTNVIGAFVAQPLHTYFESQTNHEHILLLLRQHPITQVKWIVVALIMIIAPIFFLRFPFLAFLPERYQVMTVIGWYVMTIGLMLETVLNWFFNVYIITDERVIDVDFLSLLFKNVSYAKIDRIEDVTATTAGALGSVLDYGKVMIQTAGANVEFEFENVPHPDRVAEFINEMLLQEEQERIEGRVN